METFEWAENTPVTANNLNDMQDIINANITAAITPTELWTNPNPTSSFSSQPITLSSSDYNYLEIYYYDWITPTRRGMKSVKVLKGYNINLDTIFQSTTESMMYMASRRITYTDATHLSVGPVKGANSQQLTVETINEICVPVKILGYK